MAGLCWMALAVAFSLSIGNSVAVDQNWLVKVVEEIQNRYFIPNMQFSLAANIPVDQNKLANAFDKDDPAVVKEKVLSGDVYEGTNVVEATFKKVVLHNKKEYTDHAEYRVLEKIQPLVARSQDNILILYSYLSPCGAKCTNKGHYFNILHKIKNAIYHSKWKGVAFVFSKVYDSYGYPNYVTIPPAQIQESLQNLGESIGQDNIFRCYYQDGSGFKCIKCYNIGKLSAECVQNEALNVSTPQQGLIGE